MEIDPQASLKENMVVTIFDQLDAEQQRVLIERFMRVIKKGNSHFEPKGCRENLFYAFLVKRWPFASQKFFEKAYRIWDLLSIFSKGNAHVGSCDVGDLFLQAQAGRKNDQAFIPFRSFEDREDFFWREVLEEGRWEYFHLCAYVGEPKDDQDNELYKVVDLMELEQPELDAKLSHFGYPTMQTALEWNAGEARFFATLTGCIDKEIFSKFRPRLRQISELSIWFNLVREWVFGVPSYVFIMDPILLGVGEPAVENHAAWLEEHFSYPAIKSFDTGTLILLGVGKTTIQFSVLLAQTDERYYYFLSKLTGKLVKDLILAD